MRGIVALFILSCFLACSRSADQDLVNAAALGGAFTRIAGAAQRTGGTGAVAALSAAGSGLNTGAVAFLPPGLRKQQIMLALQDRFRTRRGPRALARRNILIAARERSRNPVRPSAFTCSGTACDLVADGYYELRGTETCEDGAGTVNSQPPQNATGVDAYLEDNNGLLEYYVDGYFRYSNCGTYSVEFNNFPNYELNFLSGDAYTSGYMASTETETATTISGFFFAETEVVTTSANNFRVDGSSVVMNVLVTESEAASIFFDPSTDDILAGFASGTITLTGTINGQAVNFTGTFNENLAE